MPLTDIDRKLLSDLLAGQSGTWRLFVDRFTSLIIQVINHTAHSHSLKLHADDIEDLCADTYAELLSRDMAALRAFRGNCSLATYLGVITRRIVLRRLTQIRHLQAMGHINAHQAAVDFASQETSPARQAEQRDQIEHLFLRLPEEARRLLKWVYLEGLSYHEVARQLGRPLNSIGPMLSRIRMLAGSTKAE